MTNPSSFGSFGRTQLPIRLTLSSHSRRMEARRGNLTGLRNRHGSPMNLTKCTELRRIARNLNSPFSPGIPLSSGTFERSANHEKSNRIDGSDTGIVCWRPEGAGPTSKAVCGTRVDADDCIGDGSTTENCGESICAGGGGDAGG